MNRNEPMTAGQPGEPDKGLFDRCNTTVRKNRNKSAAANSVRPEPVEGRGASTAQCAGDACVAPTSATAHPSVGARHASPAHRPPKSSFDRLRTNGIGTADSRPYRGRPRKNSTVRLSPSARLTSGTQPMPVFAAEMSAMVWRTSPARAGSNLGGTLCRSHTAEISS